MGALRCAGLVLFGLVLSLGWVGATDTVLDMDLGANAEGPLSGTYPVPKFSCPQEGKVPSPFKELGIDELVKGGEGRLGEKQYFECLFSKYASLSMTAPVKIDSLRAIGPFIIPNFWNSVFVDDKKPKKPYNEIKDILPKEFFFKNYMDDDKSKDMSGKWAIPFRASGVSDRNKRTLLNFVSPAEGSGGPAKLNVLENFLGLKMGEALSTQDALGYYPLDYVKAYYPLDHEKAGTSSSSEIGLINLMRTKGSHAVVIESNDSKLPRRVKFEVKLDGHPMCVVEVVIIPGDRVDMVKRMVGTKIKESQEQCREVKTRDVASLNCDNSATAPLDEHVFTGGKNCVASLADGGDGEGDDGSESGIGDSDTAGLLSGVGGGQDQKGPTGFSIEIEAKREDIKDYAYLISRHSKQDVESLGSSTHETGQVTSGAHGSKDKPSGDTSDGKGSPKGDAKSKGSDADLSGGEGGKEPGGVSGNSERSDDSVSPSSAAMGAVASVTAAKAHVNGDVQSELISGWKEVLEKARARLAPEHAHEELTPVGEGETKKARDDEPRQKFADTLNETLQRGPQKPQKGGAKASGSDADKSSGTGDPKATGGVKVMHDMALTEDQQQATGTVNDSSGLRGLLPPEKIRQVMAHGFDDY